MGCSLQETHCSVGRTWAEAHASDAKPLQFAHRRQILPYHDIDGKFKLLHKPSNRSCLSQTHGIDTIGPSVSVGNGATNSLLKLRLLVTYSKSQRVGPSVDYERNSDSIP